jgi:hypothetical protein
VQSSGKGKAAKESAVISANLRRTQSMVVEGCRSDRRSLGNGLSRFWVRGSWRPVSGTTLHVWSALITVTLAALAVGYAVGGRLADRRPGLRSLMIVMASSGRYPPHF